MLLSLLWTNSISYFSWIVNSEWGQIELCESTDCESEEGEEEKISLDKYLFTSPFSNHSTSFATQLSSYALIHADITSFGLSNFSEIISPPPQ